MKKNKLLSLLISVLLLIPAVLIPVCVKAATGSYSLTMEFVVDRDNNPTPIAGSEFQIYRVLDSEGKQLVGAFSDLDITVGDLDNSESLDALCADLLANLDGVTPDGKGLKTDSTGKVTYHNLESGIYLFVGSPITKNNVKYTPKASLVRVPYVSPDGDLVTDVFVEVKYEYEKLPEPSTEPSTEPTPEPPTTPDSTERTVVKVWEDNNNPDRPSEVTIELLKDGSVVDTVTLSAQTYWKHTWDDLDADAAWTVREVNVPEGYKAKVTQSGMVFTVTNTWDSDTEGTMHPPAAKPPTDTDEKLPQTGQLWWPVLMFFVLGMGFLLAGIIAANLNDDEKEKAF